MLDQHERGQLDHSQPLWVLLMFDAFLRNAGLGQARESAAA
jgi:asparagine synthase (glutamine-hydrolysing)